jgi:2',3'-cyclic-nucleotide 2'-phosphodiesterase (5'-nucleotidase family)
MIMSLRKVNPKMGELKKKRGVKKTYLSNYFLFMKRLLVFLLFPIVIGACHSTNTLTGIGFKDYVLAKDVPRDSNYVAMLRIYKDSVDKTMDEVLAENKEELLKDLPNSNLGNFLADAYLWAAKKHSGKSIDVAFMNHGGIRVNRIASGKITRREVFEVMPFDNALVLVEIKGDLLQSYLNHLAADGGGGGVAGLTYRIQDKKAVDVLVHGMPLEVKKQYWMANSDYAVDGGGGFNGFKQLKQDRTNYLQRDAILEYCKMHQSKGKPLVVEEPKRITK